MSQDAYIVLTVVSVLIVVVFFTSVFISFITKTITKSADVIAERNALEDKARGMYHGRKYSIEVIFFDARESVIQYDNVVNHTYRDNMITIFFSKKYAVYIPLCNVKRLIVRPMLQDVNYDDCDEKKIEPKTDVLHVHDHQRGDYDIVASGKNNDGFDDFEGDWK